MNRQCCSIVGSVGALAVLCLASPSRAASFEFLGATVDVAGAPIHPAMLVGFNPQPEPPGSLTMLDMSNPARPRFHASSNGTTFGILIGLLLPAVQGQFVGLDNAAPDEAGFVHLGWQYGDGSVFQIRMHLETSSPLDGSSWVGFNPQPEPPAFPGALGFNFMLNAPARGGFEGAHTAILSVEVFNFEQPIVWEVPAPGGAACLIAAAVLTGVRRRR